MPAKRWDVLVVDDEDDVLTITKLALKNIKVYGLALNMILCRSKADAVDRLTQLPPSTTLAVAFVDVVMESDTAGLELCHYIREEMRNKVTKLIVRTGQAGKAPELEVVDRYDISSYMSKVDATDDKLYSVVKSSIREFVWAKSAILYLSLTNELIAASATREGIAEALRRRVQKQSLDGAPSEETHCAFLFDGKAVVATGEYEDSKRAVAHRDELGASRGLPLHDGADSYVLGVGNLLVRLPAAEGLPELALVLKTDYEVPELVVTQFLYPFLKSLRSLWTFAGARGSQA